ncbi:hypothetical protein [Pseudomonas massiliensis]|uniref:hypothetical protein n=1 Tax=Pseudomonas massiliensis TaxID=522492 RepID=UPI00058DF7F2|nr:hypothetical protein [Pseudomonas massiliensis]
MSKSLGHLYIARRACGKVSAMCWDDANDKKGTAKCVAGYIKRGDSVEHVERFEGDPMPEWICRPGCNDCMGVKP